MNNYKKNKKILENSFNYNEEMEHDACGVGLIASTNGKKSRKIVELGIQALKAIWHRGAVDADGKSGDGAGIQIEIAPNFFKEKILATGHSPEDDKRICVGMIFLPRTDYSKQEKCREIIEAALLEENYNIYGWRQVPINPSVLGKTADMNRPEIAQVMFKKNKNLETNDLERDLFETRKKIEKVARENQLHELYICSFSSRSIVYKGMFLAEMLSEFYMDLHDEKLTSRFAIFHQRYSTNTFPSWDLAQPFRTLAHNGEINTVKGNINWMKIHEQDMSSPLFKNVKDLKPVIRSTSDSGALDNVFELLTHSGKLAPLIKLMMIPDAWSKRSKTVPKNHQDLFNFLNSTIEPWDGPAAICATDAKWVLASSDRNGLRPLRYSISSDDLFFAGSESGMIKIPEEKIIEKGKLGPGQIIAIDLKKGKLFKDKELKDYLAKDYKKYSKQIIDLEKKISSESEKVNFIGQYEFDSISFQIFITNNAGQYYYMKNLSIPHSKGKNIYFNPTMFDPLGSLLDYYAFLFTGLELDSYDLYLGSTYYQKCLDLHSLSTTSKNASSSWSILKEDIEKIKDNDYLRKARYNFYFCIDIGINRRVIVLAISM